MAIVAIPAAKGDYGPHLQDKPPEEAGYAGAWPGPRSPRPYPEVPQMMRGVVQWKTGGEERMLEGRKGCIEHSGPDEGGGLDELRATGEAVSESET